VQFFVLCYGGFPNEIGSLSEDFEMIGYTWDFVEKLCILMYILADFECSSGIPDVECDMQQNRRFTLYAADTLNVPELLEHSSHV
jgi:hypothetical protein